MTCRTLWAKYLCLSAHMLWNIEYLCLYPRDPCEVCSPRHGRAAHVQAERHVRPLACHSTPFHAPTSVHVLLLDSTSAHSNLLTVASFLDGTAAHASIGDRSQQEGPWCNNQPRSGHARCCQKKEEGWTGNEGIGPSLDIDPLMQAQPFPVHNSWPAPRLFR